MRTRIPTEWQVSGPNYFAEQVAAPSESVFSGEEQFYGPVQWEVRGWFRLSRFTGLLPAGEVDIGKYVPVLRGTAVIESASMDKGDKTVLFRFSGCGRVTRVSEQ